MDLALHRMAGRGTWSPRLAIAALAFICAYPAGRADAASSPVWNNNTGDGLWNTGGNWSTGSAPASGDTAVFSGSTTTCSITTGVSLAAITISVPVTINVSSGATVILTGNFTQNAGTFNGGNSRMRVGGSFSLTGGTFKSTSGRLEIGAGFSKTGGTFTHNSGQVMLNATSGTQTFTSGGASFYDLTVNDSLAGYWMLDDTTGTSAADASGYGNTGTLQNSATWATSGLPGVNFYDPSAVSLDGTSQYVDVPAAVTTSNAAFTACAWVNFSSLSGAHTIVSETGTNSSAFILKRDSGGKFAFLMTSADVASPTNYQTTGTTTVATATWYHVCGVYSGSTGTLYVNGSSEGSSVAVSSSWAASGHTYIGASWWAGARADYVPGTIDDVRLYKRALTAAEVSRLAAGNQLQTGAATQTLGGSPTVAHDLIIAAGTLAAGSNALTVAGQWRNLGGLFTGTGTVTFNGSGTSNNLRSNGQSFGAISVTGTGTWNLRDALSMSTHTIAVSAGALNGVSYSILAGSITQSGTGAFTPGTGAITLDGTADATLPSGTYGALTVNTSSGLVGYWRADEGSGTSFNDSSGNGNTGTLLNSPTWSTSVPSTIQFTDPDSLSFAGGSDHGEVTISSLSLNPNSGVTVAYWLNYASVPSTSQDTLVLANGSGPVLQTGLLHSSATGCGTTDCLGAWSSGGGGTPRAYTSTPPSSGWHHFAYTWDGATSTLYIDGSSVNSTSNAPTSATLTKVYLSTYDGSSEPFTGKLDDVRIYSRALTSAEVQRLANGYSKSTPTYTLGGNTTVSGSLAITSGGVSVAAYTLTASSGLSVAANGILTLASSSSTIAVGSGQSLLMDGTLNASSTGATIQSVSGTYAFKVGSSSGATPTLNITGLKVKNTDTNGMWINADTGASTTFTAFNNIAFSSGTSGGNLLQMYAASLDLVSNGCTFDASTTYTVKLTGDGFTAGSESTQTRALFGGATCSAGSCQSTKSDDDSNNDGVPTASSGGAVVQFVSNAPTDTAGTIDGFPTAAFSWNDGSYYGTYVAFHNTSSDTVYVRDSAGAAKYSWSTSSAETIVGQPRWTTEGSSGSEKHYLYVALSDGKVYRLLDNGSSLAPDTASTGWSSANPYNCSCTITTPIALDSTNVYWAGQKTSDSSYRIWAVGQADQSVPGWSPMRPSSVSSSPPTPETAVTAAALATWSNSGSTYVFLGQTSYIVKANVSTGTVAEYNSNPGTGKSILGRIIVVGTGTNRVLAGDDGGNFWSIAPGNFSGTNMQWNYKDLAPTDQIKSSPLYDYTGGYVHFGTEGGRLVVLNASTGATLTGYPMTSLTTDPMRTAILYRSGVVAVGTTTGKLFFVNRRTTSSGTPQLMREYYFGSTEQVSGIAYDSNSSKYLVTTSSASAGDGRLFTIDATDSSLTDTDGIL